MNHIRYAKYCDKLVMAQFLLTNSSMLCLGISNTAATTWQHEATSASCWAIWHLCSSFQLILLSFLPHDAIHCTKPGCRIVGPLTHDDTYESSKFIRQNLIKSEIDATYRCDLLLLARRWSVLCDRVALVTASVIEALIHWRRTIHALLVRNAHVERFWQQRRQFLDNTHSS